ncbi:MAG: nitrilase family protein [Bacteroidales bacterium]|jgi:predicted amidohydrolase|nr:nitrilase family protein [Bacteroidales bacterium]
MDITKSRINKMESKINKMESKMNITMFQADTIENQVEENIARYSKILRNLNPTTDLLIFPEMFLTGFTFDTAMAKWANIGLEFMKNIAEAHKTAVCGSILTEEGGKYFNRSYFVYPDLSIKHYDKHHLFSISEESKLLTAGSKRLTLNYKNWNIRLITCYDIRFGSWVQNINRDGVLDYDLLICPSSWVDSRIHAFDTLLASRAIENQSFVAGVNRCGTDASGLIYSGHSAVLDFKGKVVAAANDKNEELVFCSLDREQLLRFRNAFPVWRDWE